MRYPLRIVDYPERPARDRLHIPIADANGWIVCDVTSGVGGRELAKHIVRSANRWRRWRRWFRGYTREDWEWERNETQSS